MTDMHTAPADRSAPGDDREVAVVGAGLAGFTAAVELARSGRRVVVFDARSEIGGRARTADHDGFLVNEGPHALYRTGAAFAFLCELGMEPSGGHPSAANAVGVSAESLGALPAGPASLLRTPLLRGGRLRFGRMFAGLSRLDTDALVDVPVDAGVARLVGDGPGAAIVHALLRVATYGNDPTALSAGVAIGQLRESIETPVRYVDGGWRTIIESLRTRLEDLGGRVVTGTKVESVREVGDGVEVVTAAAVHTVDAVVLAAGGPRQVASITGVDPAPFARPSTVAVLDVGLRVPWGDAPTFAVGLDEPLYLSVHGPVAALTPDGGALVAVMRYHPYGEVPDAAHDRHVCEALLERVRPGWRADAAHVGFRPRLVATHDQPQASRGGLLGRAPTRLDGHERVVIAGDWVGADGLLADAAVASGRTAAAACVRRVTV